MDSSMSDSARTVGAFQGSRSAERAELLDAVGAEALFALVYKQMRALAAVRKSRDLDDLVQLALERVVRGLPSFERRSELSTWTYRICYLTLIDHERGATRWLRRFVVGRELPETPHPGPTPAQSLEVGERIQRLRDALRRVSPKRRAVVILHDLEELGLDEIAEIVGAKRNTVKSRLRDGHRQLARLLRDDPYFGDEACGGDP